jgi:hypothetical protein
LRWQPGHATAKPHGSETWGRSPDRVHLRSTQTRRKGYGDRPVAITDLTRYLLERVELPLQRWEDGNRVRDLAAACKQSGVPRVTPNDLRRTHATWLVQAGVNDGVAGRVMGHGSAEMVRRVCRRMNAKALGDVVRTQFHQASGTRNGTRQCASTRAHKQKPSVITEGFIAGAGGLEPTTCGFGIRCSTN